MMQTEKTHNGEIQLLDPERELVLKDEKSKTATQKATKWLEAKYHRGFKSKTLPLEMKNEGIIAFHRFDLVSADNQIVAEVKDHIITMSGNISATKILDTYSACGILEKVLAKKKLLVLTDFNFYQSFRKNSNGRISTKIEIIYIPI
jgi:hypothetical protein